MITLDQKVEVLSTLVAMSDSNDWARQWYQNADIAGIVAVAFREGLVERITDKGIDFIDSAFTMAHESLGKTGEELLDLLID